MEATPPAPLQTPPASPYARRTPRAMPGAPAPPFGCPALALSIGMWSAHGARLRLLLAPHAFVLLVDRSTPSTEASLRPSATAKVERLWSAAVERLPPSPFTLPRPADETTPAAAAPEQRGATCLHGGASVLTFEVAHCHVTGLAYNSPLLLPGRLVLEAAVLTRRAFATASEALEFHAACAPPATHRAASPQPRTPPLRAASAPAGSLAASAQAAEPGGGNAAPPTRTLRSKTVVIRFDDPHLPAALRRTMLADTVRCFLLSAAAFAHLTPSCMQRMLRLVESGLPEWAVFLPAYGLLYRRWMRQAAKAIWVALGILSFAAGFYDLYRNIPGAKHALSAVYHVSGVPEARARFLHAACRAVMTRRTDVLCLRSFSIGWSAMRTCGCRCWPRTCCRRASSSRRRCATERARQASRVRPRARCSAPRAGRLPRWAHRWRCCVPASRLSGAQCSVSIAVRNVTWHLTYAIALLPRRVALYAASRACAALGAPMLRLALTLAPSGGGGGSAAAPVVAAARDGCAALWRGSRPVLAFTTHVALRLNAHRVSIQREAETRLAPLWAAFFGPPPPPSDDPDAADATSSPAASPAASPQRSAAPAAAGESAAEPEGPETDFVLARAASPWADARAARCKED
jgi:hypothetical protein